ncbi:hypothetical protein CLAIMM_04785 [Cladophialophora immunda]|nr:hypothetical protein CLAIMM_04785 [Cladophialophora immunda]
MAPGKVSFEGTIMQMPPFSKADGLTTMGKEWQALSEITYEWADSYDAKQWDRLEAIVAPHMTLDYTEQFGTKFDKIPRADFMKMTVRPDNLGGLLDCIHIVGGSKFEKHSDDKADGHHQIYVVYKRWTNMEKKEVEMETEGLLIMTHHYTKIDGVWKLCGTTPHTRLGNFRAGEIFRP